MNRSTSTLRPALRHAAGALLAVVAAILAGCSQSGSGGGTAPPSKAGGLLVGVIPYDKVEAIKQAYQPFADYLGKKTGHTPGTVYVTQDYAGIVQALRTDQIDCAYLNPLSYALATDQFKSIPERLVPIAEPWVQGKPTYHGIIFVRADSGIKSLKDLKGKSFAFGDVTSTTGYLYPRGMLIEAGIDPDKDIKTAHAGGTASVLYVANGEADAGASFDGAIQLAYPNDTAKQSQIRVIATTAEIPNGMFVARGNLDPALLASLKKAMVTVNTDPDGMAALKVMKDNKWAPGKDSDFNGVRQKAKLLNLNLSSLDQK